ncbi:MAG TPA: PQQ-dependent dehydrogenase, methanol/ethanol family [Steroidobacteraceae bacterium]|jgi:quinohemoprotein ethanol dehydrogenase
MKKALHLHLGVICVTTLLTCLPSMAPAQAAPAARPRAGNVTDERLRHADQDPGDWLTHGGNWQELRYSRLTGINATNVAALRPAWSAEFDTTRGQEATPIVVDGVMYVSTSWSKVYALDAATGRQIWYYDPKVPGPTGAHACCDVVNRGVAVYEGNVYLATLDGRLIALNAGTGKPVWTVRMFEYPSRRYSSTGAPRAARGKIYIGNAGADFGGRGFVSAYDARTGRRVWRFYTVPGDPAGKPDGAASDAVLKSKALKTWSGDWLKYGGGGQVWNALVYDPDFNQIYMATGNGFPWNQNYRSNGGGDNLFISSIIAVDADTGRYHWHYQETPGDRWDYDAVADMTLVDLPLAAGGVRKVLLHAPKNGFFYVLDRRTGELLSADAYVPGINWATGVDLKTGRPQIVSAALYKDAPWLGIPGGGGAHSWHPVAFNPDTGLLYIPAAESSTFYSPTKDYKYDYGLEEIGVDLDAATHGAVSTRPHMPPRKDYLLAWNPVTRKAAFSVPGAGGGLLTTAGNLIFQGRPREGVLGTFVALRATDGRALWSWNTPDAMAGGPVTYLVNGEQYVAVISGALSYSGTATPRVRHNGRMLAFKLNGTGTFPADPGPAPPPNPPTQVGRPDQVALGETIYGKRCGLCHGFDTVSSNIVPDLRRSAFLTSPEGWQAVVIGGALASRGMISWKDSVTPAQAEAVRAFVGERARSLKLDLDHKAVPP